jgi:hypothetical protein
LANSRRIDWTKLHRKEAAEEATPTPRELGQGRRDAIKQARAKRPSVDEMFAEVSALLHPDRD